MSMAERIDEAHRMVRKFLDTPYERAAMAYLAAQVEIAGRCKSKKARGT